MVTTNFQRQHPDTFFDSATLIFFPEPGDLHPFFDHLFPSHTRYYKHDHTARDAPLRVGT
jgi:Mlc titration factor MtfA (ptsG expression regulator)